MKAQTHSSYFQRKNTKRGMALSTAMAISIVLAILVALLVSMATLNIVTTQDTVSQREAYIQAKSAISFAESYYISHDDQIPGNADGNDYGEAVMIFTGDDPSGGAEVYVTKSGSTEILSSSDVDILRQSAPVTYLDIVNTSATLDITAYCKYDSGSYYKLTKEFDLLDSSSRTQANSFNGNIIYTIGSDTRYLRIHVRTSEAFGYEPYLYTWATTVEEQNSSGTVKNATTFSNKLGDAGRSIHLSGEWIDPEHATSDLSGPQGAMTYEGNGWYVYEIPISTDVNISTINAIVARKGAYRTDGLNSQTWEFFGIPVPQEKGSENGTDVYITLNKSYLQDAQNNSGTNLISGSSDEIDDLSRWFQNGGANITKFAQMSSQYYSVYTKRDTGIIHIRDISTYTDDSSNSGSGIGTYEGYGWYRSVSHNFSDTVTIGGSTFTYGDGKVTSYNSYNYNKEQVREYFICVNGSEVVGFEEEADANEFFVSRGDSKAADYVTVNVKGDNQPVDAAVTTNITYKYDEVDGTSTPPTPPVTGSTDIDVSVNAGEELNVQKLAITSESKTPQVLATASTTLQTSGDAPSVPLLDVANYKRIYYRATDAEATADWDTSFGYSIECDGMGLTMMTQIPDTNTGSGNKSDYYYADVPVDAASVKVHPNVSDSEADTSKTVEINVSTGNSIYFCDGPANDFNTISAGNTIYFANRTHMDTPAVYGSMDGGNSWFYGMDTGSTFGTPMYPYESSTVIWWADIPATTGTVKICDWTTGENAVTAGTNFGSSEICLVPSSDGSSTWMTLDDAQRGGGLGGYLIMGNFAETGNWSHQYADALAMQASTDGSVYTYVFQDLAVGNYAFKVISSDAECEPDENGYTIDYNYSWGDSYGSGANDVEFTLSSKSDVTVTFTVNEGGDSSKITYSITPKETTVVTWKQIAFYNGQLTNLSDSSQKTDFTAPWSTVYVTYVLSDGSMVCNEVNLKDPSNPIIWGEIPNEAEYIYFSNMPTADRGSAGYEYTENIDKSKFSSIINPVFFPMTSTSDSNGKIWTIGDNDLYRTYTTKVTTKTDTSTMAYSDTNQVAYYNVPIVNMLDKLSGKSGVVYSPEVWSSGYKWVGKTYHFNKNNYVTYLGEKYYYSNESAGSFSFMIINNGESGKYAVIYSGQFAITSDNTVGLDVDMDNRAGAAFTSTGSLYDGSTSGWNYSGYVPDWYTYKIPAATTYSIQKITNLNGSSSVDVNTANLPVTKSTSGGYLNQPIYITYDSEASTHVGLYTYNIDEGRVDANTSNQVTVYFQKPDDWSKAYCHAYGVNSEDDIEMNVDTSDEDGNNYYSLTFDSGKFAYFVFHDGNGIDDTNTKKSSVLYLTGEENPDTRECKILARGAATEFEYYLHPKTKALYAFAEARSAANEAVIYEYYTYDAATGVYTGVNQMTMAQLDANMNDAKTYYEHRSSWSSAAVANYSGMADAARNLVSAIKQARVYISDDKNTAGSHYIFPEGEYRDSAVDYADRWKQTLKAAYDDAIAIYSDTSRQNAGDMQAAANVINNIISSPEIILASNAVQIIIDDQGDSTNGIAAWGKDNIHIFNNEGGSWHEVPLTLQNTTQTGFYGYAFVDPLGGEYAIIKGTGTPQDTDATQAITSGSRYFFTTSTGKWENDNSTPTITVTVDEIEQGGANSAYGVFESPIANKDFVIYFQYDTKVKYGSTEYTIYAGTYKMNALYSGFRTDVTGNVGINLFSDKAKNFFNVPCGLAVTSSVSSSSFTEWKSSIPRSSAAVDILTNQLTGVLSATSDKSVNLRCVNTKDASSVLEVRDAVTLEGQTVTMAVNTLDISVGCDFILNGKSITFYTDTTVKTASGSYTIQHGTYIFSGAVKTPINLKNEDWKDHYILIASTDQSLGGGMYVAK